MKKTKETASELEFLRYFYVEADSVFGPASDDVYEGIKQNFKEETGKELPEGYTREEE